MDDHGRPAAAVREARQREGLEELLRLSTPVPARHRKRRKQITITLPPLPQLRHLVQAVAIAVTAVVVLVASLYLVDRPVSTAAGRPRPYAWPHGVPVGITLSGLQDYIMTPAVITTMERQARAARYSWHANTVRLQILQDRLVGAGGNRWAAYYMSDIRQITDYCLHLGLTVVLNAQTEQSTGYALNEPLPTKATYVFWQRIAHWYGGNPHVVFDLFNEPRHCTWGEWYDTHQGLVTDLRRRGVTNWLWVEGRWWGATLQGVPLIRDPLHRVVYSFHHPGAPKPWQAPVTAATWDAAFGELANRGVPVVDGEFANYVGSYDWAWPQLPGGHPGVLVREYLAYLTAHHIGMLAWSLIPGALNRTLRYDSVSREPQGDGALVRAWFRAVTSRKGVASMGGGR